MSSVLLLAIHHEVSVHGGLVEIDAAGRRRGKAVARQFGAGDAGPAQVGAVEVGMRDRRIGEAGAPRLDLHEAGKARISRLYRADYSLFPLQFPVIEELHFVCEARADNLYGT